MNTIEVPSIWKTYKFKLKEAKDDGTISGYASMFGVVDSDDEVVDRGAFKRSISLSNGIMPVLWQHDRNTPVGWGVKAEEDDRGLYVEAKLLLDTEVGRLAYSYVKNGLAVGGKPGISIGFMVPSNGTSLVNGKKHFTEVQLKEWSIVTFQACPGAVADEAKGAVAFGDLPLASDDVSWDASAAREALAKWAGGPDKENINWSKYRRGFFWFDSSAPNEIGSYKLPFATISGGKLMAVPRGVMAAAGGHGVDAADIPSEDKVKIKAVIGRYYKKMKKDSPFKSENPGGKGESMATTTKMKEIELFKASDFNTQMDQNQKLGDHFETKWKMSRALDEAISNIKDDEDMSLAEKKPLIHKCLDQHCEAMKSWWSTLLDITQPDDADNTDDSDEGDDSDKAKKNPPRNYDDEQSMTVGQRMDAVVNWMSGKALSAKEGRAISDATKKKLDTIVGHIKDANGHAQAAMDSHVKGLGALNDLSVGRYFNDVNAENPVGGSGGGGVKPTENPVGGAPKAEDLNELMKTLTNVKGSLQVVPK